MATRSRTRRVFKWGGLAFCTLVVGIWAVTPWWCIGYASGDYNMAAERGCVFFLWDALVFSQSSGHDGWQFEASSRMPPGWRMFGLVLPKFFARPGRYRAVQVPLWLLLLVLGTPTAFLFWRDRRRYPPGHCRSCGYNLTGNESGICPECGTACQVLGGAG